MVMEGSITETTVTIIDSDSKGHAILSCIVMYCVIVNNTNIGDECFVHY